MRKKLVALPETLIEWLEHETDKRGLTSFSATIRQILILEMRKKTEMTTDE